MVVEALVGVELIKISPIIESYHKGFIDLLNLKKLQKTKISEITGSRSINKNINWDRMLKEV